MHVGSTPPAYFNPRSPHGERQSLLLKCSSRRYFNPRSPHGERHQRTATGAERFSFQPTLPARGATPHWLQSAIGERFQPTLPARGATTDGDAQAPPRKISTHAPRTGSDPAEGTNEAAEWHFNPRSPHGERLDAVTSITVGSWISTHAPRTGSDVMGNHNCLFIIDFNPRSPHGERHQLLQGTLAPTLDFNPRSPHGERPHWDRPKTSAKDISTHAPRTGSDVFPDARTLGRRDFNPRSPHGERHTARPKNGGLKDISTHAPRTGSDKQVWLANRMAFEFQPTLPARGATPSATRAFGTSRFQPTLPARGATGFKSSSGHRPAISTHAPRTGSDRRR